MGSIAPPRQLQLPTRALGVRQPWAWALIYAAKNIENRDWKWNNPDLKFRKEFCVHASKDMTRDEYEEARSVMKDLGVTPPRPNLLQFGGIIGTARVADIVTASPSKWFFGPYGLRIEDPKPCDFIKVKGALGFFPWKPEPGGPFPPKKWMREWKE